MQLRLGLQYDGGGFEGWQLQPSGPTIQLMTLLDKHPELLDELR